MSGFTSLFGGANPRRAADAAKQQAPAKQQTLQEYAKDAAKQARKMLQDTTQAMSQKSGMVLVCVEGAKLVCNLTIPKNKINVLKVPVPRSIVEGKRLAQVQDVKRDTNIPAWPCKCRNRPSGSDFLPCDYKPAGIWTPGVQTETNDASPPKNRSEAYKKGYETGYQRGLETAQAMRNNPGVMQALEHGAANSSRSFGDLASFAAVESTGNPLAVLGQYKGLMQMGPAAAQQVGMSYGSMIGGSQAAMNNNVLGGARYMEDNLRTAKILMDKGALPAGHQIGPADSYMMHQQGPSGYADMVKTIGQNPNAPLTGAQMNQAVDGVTTQGAFKDYFDGKFDGANDAIRKSFPDKVKSKVPPGMMAIPEVATHRCAIGGTIRIVDPGQRSKRAKLGGASMKP